MAYSIIIIRREFKKKLENKIAVIMSSTNLVITKLYFTTVFLYISKFQIMLANVSLTLSSSENTSDRNRMIHISIVQSLILLFKSEISVLFFIYTNLRALINFKLCKNIFRMRWNRKNRGKFKKCFLVCERTCGRMINSSIFMFIKVTLNIINYSTNFGN